MSTFWKIFITAAVTSAVVGSGVFYLMQRQIDNIRNDNLKQTDDLNKQIKALKSTSAALTASWKTYTSTTDGYTIKYPNSWVYDNPDKGSIVFRITEGDHWQFDIEISATTKTLQQNVSNELAVKQSGGYTTAATDETIAGQPASKVTISGGAGPDIIEHLVVKGDKLFIISLTDNSDPDLIKMLQTFQFTPVK